MMSPDLRVKSTIETGGNMLRRCYSTNSDYEGVTVCKEWLLLSNYKKWHDSRHRGMGYQIDKDAKRSNVYSPESCIVIPEYINKTLQVKRGGKFLPGVYISKLGERYSCKIRKGGKQIGLGTYDTEEEAHRVYCEAKEGHVAEIAFISYMRNEIGLLEYNSLLCWKVA